MWRYLERHLPEKIEFFTSDILKGANNNKMKIAFITQPWDVAMPIVGGHSSIPILTYQIAYRLARAGHDIIIYAKKGHNQQNAERDEEGIEYRRISVSVEDKLLKPIKVLDRISHFGNPKRPFFATKIYYLGYVLQIARDLRKQKADIIHVHNFSQFVPIIRVFNPQAKIVLHMHCEWLSQLDQTMIERRLDKTDLVIGCSEYITKKTQQRFPQLAHRCQTVCNGVDINKFVGQNGQNTIEKENNKRLIFVGRVSPEKGVHVLLEAFHKVADHYPQVQLDIIGPPGNAPLEFVVLVSDDDQVAGLSSFYGHALQRGDYYSYLQNSLPSNLADQVNFVGPVSHTQIIDYYHQADLFTFPSVWDEPFGIPIVEAMACQVPVVATNSGGITAIVQDGKTGLLVERGNVDSLARAILKILLNDDLSESMGKAGRQRVLELFSWDNITENLLCQYQKITR